MCLATNIVRRGAVYYIRLSVPVELQRAREAAGIKKATEIWKSLGTKDPKEAKRIAPTITQRQREAWDSELAALLAGIPIPEPVARKAYKPTQAEIEAAAWQWVAEDLRTYERQRQALGPARAEERERRKAEREAISGPLFAGSEVLFPSAADMYGNVAEALIKANGWDVLPESPEFLHLCNIIRGGRLTTLNAMEARDGGDYLSPTANPKRPPQPVTASEPEAPKAKPGESLTELWPQYMRERGKNRSVEDQHRKERVVKRFAEFVGERRSIKTITKDDATAFKRDLAHFPRNADNYHEFKGKPFPEIVKVNRAKKHPTINAKTLNNYLSMLGGYWRWLNANGYTSVSRITEDLAIEIPESERSRDSFTHDELKAIFALPAFTGCESSKEDNRPGTVRLSDWRFWIPVICLYTGARLGEIAQLRKEDLRKEQGKWCFHITDDGEGMTAKTKNSRRFVPVHPELIRLGLLTYHAKQTNARLFPELEPEAGRLSTPVSKWWRRQLRGQGIKRIEGTQHQFRHTYMDALRAAGYMNSEIRPLVGHKEGSTTEDYGNLPQGTIQKRATMVESVTLPVTLTPPK